MKKYLLISFLTLIFFQANSQELFYHSGKNLTHYIFKTTSQSMVNLRSGIGTNNELGITFKNHSFSYSISGLYNEYNASGSTAGATIEWNSEYIGLNNTLRYNFYNSNHSTISLDLGLAAQTIVYGRQKTNLNLLDLTKQNEFTGIFAGPNAGVWYSYRIRKDFNLQIGYRYERYFNLKSQKQENLNLKNHSFNIGFSVNID